MKYALILLVLVLVGCESDKKNSLSECIFPIVQDSQTELSSTKVRTLKELWEISAKQDSVRCKNSDFLLFDFMEIENLCIPVTIDWSCDGPIECELVRYRDVVEVCINGKNEILWHGKLANVDAIDTLFEVYYLNQGLIPARPKSPYSTRFYVEWSKDSDLKFVERIILKLAENYTRVIRNEIGKTDNYCRFYENKKKQLLSKYPFRLKLVYDEWDYDRIPPVPPLPPENIEIDDEDVY